MSKDSIFVSFLPSYCNFSDSRSDTECKVCCGFRTKPALVFQLTVCKQDQLTDFDAGQQNNYKTRMTMGEKRSP